MTQREYDCWHCLNSWLLVEKRGYLGVTRTNDGMMRCDCFNVNNENNENNELI